MHRNRLRAAAFIVLPALVAGLVGACGSGGGESEGGKVKLRFAWWGSDTRHELTQKVIKRFEQSHPNIDIEGEFNTWEGYWDKLGTQVAGNDAPDVIQMDWDYLRDYADRGALLDLSGVETGDIAPQVVSTGEVEGTLYALPAGINAYTMVADPEAFDEAGAKMPDDETWTWEDYQRIAAQLTKDSPKGVYGAEEKGYNETSLQIFARQRGEDLYTQDGKLGVSPQIVRDWWQISLDMLASGGTPSASTSSEVYTLGPEQSLLAKRKAAMGFWWSNQLTALNEASGRQLELLRYPGESAGQPGMYFKSSQFFSVSARTEHPEEAKQFVNWLVNDRAAVEILLSERGLPPNTKLLQQVQDKLPEVDAQVADFMADIADEVGEPPMAPPAGADEVEAIVQRLNDEVLFKRVNTNEAASRLAQEIDSAIEP
ncbi:MAG: extracellular solute-binding protein [Streptosporangiales bacterium]|nr:extracellular solute-binding protein [Streptosporangiales bacterium]